MFGVTSDYLREEIFLSTWQVLLDGAVTENSRADSQVYIHGVVNI